MFLFHNITIEIGLFLHFYSSIKPWKTTPCLLYVIVTVYLFISQIELWLLPLVSLSAFLLLILPGLGLTRARVRGVGHRALAS
jgi:hypothetical protein